MVGETNLSGAPVFDYTQDCLVATMDYRVLIRSLHLPFSVLSDADLALVTALKLPVFTVEGMTLMRRLTLAIRDGLIRHVFYPIENPAGYVEDVLAWLKQAGR
ncbi:redoxin family protein [Thalassospira sp. TSL5-1]|uniref:redoxin family protein n=1 Tax=Thalassospira sp. TSL5-1 TaxID=1544451 RepID=UPI00093B3A8A|nr:redoxin family protein [Thalassospira sp. TSL5-1]